MFDHKKEKNPEISQQSISNSYQETSLKTTIVTLNVEPSYWIAKVIGINPLDTMNVGTTFHIKLGCFRLHQSEELYNKQQNQPTIQPPLQQHNNHPFTLSTILMQPNWWKLLNKPLQDASDHLRRTNAQGLSRQSYFRRLIPLSCLEICM